MVRAMMEENFNDDSSLDTGSPKTKEVRDMIDQVLAEMSLDDSMTMASTSVVAEDSTAAPSLNDLAPHLPPGEDMVRAMMEENCNDDGRLYKGCPKTKEVRDTIDQVLAEQSIDDSVTTTSIAVVAENSTAAPSLKSLAPRLPPGMTLKQFEKNVKECTKRCMSAKRKHKIKRRPSGLVYKAKVSCVVCSLDAILSLSFRLDVVNIANNLIVRRSTIGSKCHMPIEGRQWWRGWMWNNRGVVRH